MGFHHRDTEGTEIEFRKMPKGQKANSQGSPR